MKRTITRRRFVAGASSLVASGCAGTLVDVSALKKAEACAADDGSCAIVDAHSHTFNGSDLPIQGFVSHVAPVPRSWSEGMAGRFHTLVDSLATSGEAELAQLDALRAKPGPLPLPKLTPLPEELEQLALDFAAKLELGAAGDKAERLAQLFALIVRPRHEIAQAMAADYPQVDLFTPALVDYAYWSSDATKTPLHDQIRVQAVLAELSREGRLGAAGRPRLHPFAPFNPLREARERMSPGAAYAPLGTDAGAYACNAPTPLADDALKPGAGSLAPLRYAIEKLGFAGVKLYPPIGYLPIGNTTFLPHRDGLGAQLDLALRTLYAYCEAEDVPVMTHANNTNGYATGYGVLTAPAQWEPVLQAFPNLRLNLGHFGDLHGDDGERGVEACELWMRQIADLMHRYPNVYADLGYSCVPIEQEKSQRYLTLLEALLERYPVVADRILYGSDYWLNRIDANHEASVDMFDDVFRTRFADVHARFMGGNALRYLGFKGAGAGNRNYLRALALYGAAPPRWLAGG
jgi:predicted TIM-barrel fold metal-dependent hydrolase